MDTSTVTAWWYEVLSHSLVASLFMFRLFVVLSIWKALPPKNKVHVHIYIYIYIYIYRYIEIYRQNEYYEYIYIYIYFIYIYIYIYYIYIFTKSGDILMEM